MSKGKVSFEEALKELEVIVRKLESGEISLDESLVMYEKGVSLARLCSAKLDAAEAKIQMLVEKDGKISKEDMVLTEEDEVI